MKYRQGFFRLKNPSKYLGDSKNVVYRSSYELRAFIKLDNDPNIVKWSSEEIAIPYRSPLDKQWHRYFVDIYCENIRGEKYLIEIKPWSQTIPPILTETKTGKPTKSYLKACLEWAKNQAKWQAAEAYAKSRGYRFQIITEAELNINNRKGQSTYKAIKQQGISW